MGIGGLLSMIIGFEAVGILAEKGLELLQGGSIEDIQDALKELQNRQATAERSAGKRLAQAETRQLEETGLDTRAGMEVQQSQMRMMMQDPGAMSGEQLSSFSDNLDAQLEGRRQSVLETLRIPDNG